MYKIPHRRQIIVAIVTVSAVAAACYPVSGLIGYRSVALILLLTVSVLAMVMHLVPVVVAAVLSALVWDYFFIPPHFTLTIGSGEDGLLIVMYFIVALLNAVIHYRVRELDKIKRQKEEKEHTIHLYNTLFNSLSHELRTPLATVMGAADMLIDHESQLLPSQKGDLLREISNGALRLNKQVDNLLNVSRLEAGVITPQKTWCDVAELIYEAVEQVSDEGKNHETKVILSDNLPLVQLDFGLTLQALRNLLENAYRHTPDGTKIVIESTLTPKSGEGEWPNASFATHQLTISVSDNGPGFLEDEYPHIFECFFRSKRSKTGGNGQGLYIVKGFLEAQGAQIRLAPPAADSGAHFELYFPTGVRANAAHELSAL